MNPQKWNSKYIELRKYLKNRAHQTSVWHTGTATVIAGVITLGLLAGSVILGNGFNNVAAALGADFDDIPDYLNHIFVGSGNPPSQESSVSNRGDDPKEQEQEQQHTQEQQQEQEQDPGNDQKPWQCPANTVC